MLPRPMLSGQIPQCLWEYVLDISENPPLKFYQHRISNSCDLAEIEILWVVGGGGVKSFLRKPQPLS